MGSVNGPKTRWSWFSQENFFQRWSSFFFWMSTSKLVTFKLMRIHKPLLRRRYILRMLLFGVLYGQSESLVQISLKMKPTLTLQSKGNAIEPWLMTFTPKVEDVDESRYCWHTAPIVAKSGRKLGLSAEIRASRSGHLTEIIFKI